MAIKAVVFDIGGVLEFNPRTDWGVNWEGKLGLQPGDINVRLRETWRAGSIGTIPLEEVERNVREILGFDQAQLDAFMADLWQEYVGTPNVAMIEYFAGLHSRYQTAIISNSFVGAREREEELYHFGGMCDLIIYSHEVGMSKPDRRIFDIALEKLGVQPNEMIFVDDVPGHIAAARELGIRGVIFKDNAQTFAEIEALLAGPPEGSQTGPDLAAQNNPDEQPTEGFLRSAVNDQSPI